MHYWLLLWAAISTTWTASAQAQETDGRVWIGVGPSPFAYEQQSWTIENGPSETRTSLNLGLENEASVAVGHGVGAWVFAGQLTGAYAYTENEIVDIRTADPRVPGPSSSVTVTTLSVGPLVRYVLGGTTLRPFGEAGAAFGISHTRFEQNTIATVSSLKLVSASAGFGSMLRLSDRVSLDAALRVDLSAAWGEQRLPGIYTEGISGLATPVLGTRSFDTAVQTLRLGLALRLSAWL